MAHDGLSLIVTLDSLTIGKGFYSSGGLCNDAEAEYSGKVDGDIGSHLFECGIHEHAGSGDQVFFAIEFSKSPYYETPEGCTAPAIGWLEVSPKAFLSLGETGNPGFFTIRIVLDNSDLSGIIALGNCAIQVEPIFTQDANRKVVAVTTGKTVMLHISRVNFKPLSLNQGSEAPVIEELSAEAQAKDAEGEEATEPQIVKKIWREREDAFKAKTPDYEHARDTSDVKVSDEVRDAILESEMGPQIIYHFAKHPEDAERINTLTVGGALRELGRLEARLAKPGQDKMNFPEGVRRIAVVIRTLGILWAAIFALVAAGYGISSGTSDKLLISVALLLSGGIGYAAARAIAWIVAGFGSRSE
jgi:hypothetical protein